MDVTQEDRQRLVDLCLEALEVSNNGSRLPKKTRVGLNMSIVLSMELPGELIVQGIEGVEAYLKLTKSRKNLKTSLSSRFFT